MVVFVFARVLTRWVKSLMAKKFSIGSFYSNILTINGRIKYNVSFLYWQ